jgi:hypothetical protein
MQQVMREILRPAEHGAVPLNRGPEHITDAACERGKTSRQISLAELPKQIETGWWHGTQRRLVPSIYVEQILEFEAHVVPDPRQPQPLSFDLRRIALIHFVTAVVDSPRVFPKTMG